VEPWAACVIGIIAGWVYMAGSRLLLHFKIDDAVDAIPVHMCGGTWGLLAAGLFSSQPRLLAAFGRDSHTGFLYSLGRGSLDAQLLLNQIVALLFLMSWAFVTMYPFFKLLNYVGWLRADSLEELVGLDMSFMRSGLEERPKAEEEVKQEDVETDAQGKKSTHNKAARFMQPVEQLVDCDVEIDCDEILGFDESWTNMTTNPALTDRRVTSTKRTTSANNKSRTEPTWSDASITWEA
jgi:hypothetical protein